MGYLNLPFLDISININKKAKNVSFLNAFLLGFVYSVSIGACGLGYIMQNLSVIFIEANLIKSILIGAVFTLTFDLLFIICALLFDQLKAIMSFITKHYKVINVIAGTLLVIFGFMLELGFSQKLLTLFN